MALPCEGPFPLVIWLPWPTDINRLLQGKNTSQRALWAIFMHSGWNLSVSETFKESHNSVQNWDQKRLEDTISPKCWTLIGWGISPSLAPRNRLEDTIHRAKEMRKKATCLCRQIWWEYSASSGFAIKVPFCQGCLKRDTVNRLSDCLLLKGPSSEAGWERENRFNLHSFLFFQDRLIEPIWYQCVSQTACEILILASLRDRLKWMVLRAACLQEKFEVVLKGPSFSTDFKCLIAESIKDGPLRRRMLYGTVFERGISDQYSNKQGMTTAFQRYFSLRNKWWSWKDRVCVWLLVTDGLKVKGTGKIDRLASPRGAVCFEPAPTSLQGFPLHAHAWPSSPYKGKQVITAFFQLHEAKRKEGFHKEWRK